MGKEPELQFLSMGQPAVTRPPKKQPSQSTLPQLSFPASPGMAQAQARADRERHEAHLKEYERTSKAEWQVIRRRLIADGVSPEKIRELCGPEEE